MTELKPERMDRAGLVAVLEDILERVRAGDSWEGHLTWSLPDPDEEDPGGFDVSALYRIGNLQGQGGVSMVGDVPELPT